MTRVVGRDVRIYVDGIELGVAFVSEVVVKPQQDPISFAMRYRVNWPGVWKLQAKSLDRKS